MTEKFDDMSEGIPTEKNKLTDVQGHIDNLKNIEVQNELGKLKGKALDVDSHINTVKAKGSALMDKIKELGIGGGSILVLGFIAQMFLPWWSIAVVAFIVGIFVHHSASRSMVYGMVAVTLLWSIYAGWQSSANGGIMSTAISDLLGGKLSVTQLIISTGIIGGLVGGFAALSGTLFRNLFKP